MYGALSLAFAACAFADRPDLARIVARLGLFSFDPAIRPEDVSEARLFQSAVARCLRSAARRERLPDRDLETVNSYAGDEPPLVALRPDGTAARSSADPVRAVLAAVARDAVETIARHAGALRTCEADGCGRTFLDLSRAQRRRWCSMSRCGNRVKVAAFRRRQPKSRPEASSGGS